MNHFRRRSFLQTSAGSLAALLGLNMTSGGFASPVEWPDESDGASATVSRIPEGPDTLFLTWQQDPTTTITIQWLAPSHTDPISIHYKPLEGGMWLPAPMVQRREYPGTDLKVHRCEITQLLAGTEYLFQINSTGPEYRFRTLPAKATNTFDFVTGGDSGIDQHAIATNMLAAKQEPYFVLIAGDLAYDNGKSPDTFTAFLKNYRREMIDPKGRLIPMISCIGNHEVVGGYKATRANSPQYLALFDGFYAEKTYGVLDIGDYLSLVLLDTNHIAPVEGEQTDWLATVLASRQDRPHLFVVNHVPAYPSYRPPYGENGKLGTGEDQRIHWCPLFEKFRVDIVLEHHDHTFKRTHPLTNGMIDKKGVLYLGDGSWGKLRVPKTPEERPYLAKVAQAYHMTVHRLEGDQRFHIALEESGKVADACSTYLKRA